MITNSFLCYLVALYWLCWLVRPHCATTDVMWNRFKVDTGVRYTSSVVKTRQARSVLDCSAQCAKEDFCNAFSFGFGQCELLWPVGCGGLVQDGWSYGYLTTGK